MVEGEIERQLKKKGEGERGKEGEGDVLDLSEWQCCIKKGASGLRETA